MISRWRHHWTCPLCSFVNRWTWPGEDHNDLGEETWLLCDNCGRDSLMFWRGPGQGWVLGTPQAGSPLSPFTPTR